MSGCPDIHICLRPTLDWSDRDLVEKNLFEIFRYRYELWNKTFTVPYHLFRHRLKTISQANLRRVRGATLTPFEQTPTGVLAVPVDDDDWFAPDLAERLAAAWTPGVVGYWWDKCTLKAPQEHLLIRLSRWIRGVRLHEGARKRYTCASNNYAMIHDGTPESLNRINRHGSASRHFDANPAVIRRLPGRMSIQNKSLASQTTLVFRQSIISRRKLLRRFNRYKNFYRDLRMPDDLAWAQPCVVEMDQLMREIELR
jgi:hypothetical protein